MIDKLCGYLGWTTSCTWIANSIAYGTDMLAAALPTLFLILSVTNEVLKLYDRRKKKREGVE